MFKISLEVDFLCVSSGISQNSLLSWPQVIVAIGDKRHVVAGFWGTSEATIVFCWYQRVCTGSERPSQLTHGVHHLPAGSFGCCGQQGPQFFHPFQNLPLQFLESWSSFMRKGAILCWRRLPFLGQWELDSSLILSWRSSSLVGCQFCSMYVSLFPYELPPVHWNNSHIKVIFSPTSVLEKNLCNKSVIFIHM